MGIKCSRFKDVYHIKMNLVAHCLICIVYSQIFVLLHGHAPSKQVMQVS